MTDVQTAERDAVVMQHFVTFYSPGTFVAETTRRPIYDWDIELAMQMAREIKERHAATPYGFRFSTRGRNADELDSKELKASGMFYLGGKIETLAEVEARDPNSILAGNMRRNKIARIVVNDNSWRWTQELNDEDSVLDFTP